ncbi:MAG: CAP domain-containing protein [Isosphaeraceae bacterium]|nr:CAP domain-containing protein [Isosphaeraceae bacterium]
MNVARSWALLLACMTLAGCAASPPRSLSARAEPPLLIGDQAEAEPELQLVAAHNKLRAREGLPPLEPSPELTAAAMRHARDMASHQRMRHRGSDGTTPFQRMSQEGYDFRLAGENVAYGQPTVDAVMDAWWRSPPHRSNVLGNFSQIGTGTATAEDGSPYWCVTFGKPSGG